MKHHHYNMKVHLSFPTGEMSVSGTLAFVISQPEVASIRFYLHQDFDIHYLCGNAVESFVFDKAASQHSFITHSRPIDIALSRPASQGEVLQLEFAYSGKLHFDENKSIGRIGLDYTELALYAPWFLLTPTVDQATFDVEISMDPSDMELFGGEGLERTASGWRIVQTYPSFDCCILASPAFKENVYHSGTDHLTINTAYVEEQEQPVAEYLSVASASVVEFLTELIGSCEQSTHNVAILPRTFGGGYNRKGLVVLSRFEEEEKLPDLAVRGMDGYYKYLAHEIAHLWWNKAPTTIWEDWLNESFAEYSALLVWRQLKGVDAYRSRIAELTEKIIGLPPIWEIDRQNEKAYATLYRKGPVLMHGWAQRVGEESFHTFLRAVHHAKVTRTLDLLALAEHHFGEAMALQIEADLKR